MALSMKQKIEILHLWASDVAALTVALEEGMPDGDDDLQRQFLLALETMRAAEELEHAGPTKHHGILD